MSDNEIELLLSVTTYIEDGCIDESWLEEELHHGNYAIVSSFPPGTDESGIVVRLHTILEEFGMMPSSVGPAVRCILNEMYKEQNNVLQT